MSEALERCRVCMEDKTSCASLYELVLDHYLPTVIEYVCGVQISEEEHPKAVACTDCAIALIQASNIIKKFRASQKFFLQQYELESLVEEEYIEEEHIDVTDVIHHAEPLYSIDTDEYIEYLECESLEDVASMDPVKSDEVTPPEDFTEVTEISLSIKPKQNTQSQRQPKYFCYLCHFKTDLVQHYRFHMLEEHEIEHPRIFKCSSCKDSYASNWSLQEHIAAMHNKKTKNKSFFCSVCGKSFIKQSHLQRHSYVHRPEERPFRCEVCHMLFASMTSLKNHMSTMHSEIRPYGCDLCGKSFAIVYGLNAHMKRVHGPKRFDCPKCSVHFSKSKLLDHHLLYDCPVLYKTSK